MAKYAVMAVLDLDVVIPDGETEDLLMKIEKITENRIRTTLESRGRGIKIKMLRTKFLGLAEEE